MTLADRLRQARINAGYRFAAEAARAFGWRDPTYRQHESGDREPSRQTVARYAKAFHVSVTWLETGQGSRGFTGVPVMGKVGAGARIYPITDGMHELDRVPAPPGAPEDATAVVVDGDSMWPAYRHGDVIVYAARIEVDPAAGATLTHDTASALIGKECVVQMLDGRAAIKIISRGTADDRWRLDSYNAPPIEDAQLVWVAPVIWVRRG